jgi:hypothetical protein
MTLEDLRPLLAHYNAPGAVLRVLELGGAWTAAQLVGATGKPRSRVYEALERLSAEGGPVVREGPGYALRPGIAPDTSVPKPGHLEPPLSRKRDKPEPDAPDFVPEAGHPGQVIGGDLSRKRDTLPPYPVPETGQNVPEAGQEQCPGSGTVPETGHHENAERHEQNAVCPESGTAEFAPSFKSLPTDTKLLKQKDKKTTTERERERKPKPPRTAYDPPLDERVPGWVPRELWADWCQHRRDIRHPLTRLAVTHIVRDLEAWAERHGREAVLEALRASIKNGWRGVFEPRPAARASPPRRVVDREALSEEEWLASG